MEPEPGSSTTGLGLCELRSAGETPLGLGCQPESRRRFRQEEHDQVTAHRGSGSPRGEKTSQEPSGLAGEPWRWEHRREKGAALWKEPWRALLSPGEGRTLIGKHLKDAAD